MDLRKINSYMILLAIVVVVGLFVSTVARLVILAKGVDAGTANLVFLIMLGTCAIAYLTILAAFSSIADFIADKILPKIARKKALTAEATRIPPIDDPIRMSSKSSRRQTNDFSNGRKNRSNCSDVMGIER